MIRATTSRQKSIGLRAIPKAKIGKEANLPRFVSIPLEILLTRMCGVV